MRQYVKTFKALSDSNRLRILKMLQLRPLCVCEIQAVLNLATSTVSKHLSILREAGFIYDVKENKWVNYYIESDTSNEMINALLSLMNKDMSNQQQVLKDKELVKKVDRNQLCKI
jgi:ArsR family transcriptional regulator, arsenate/arsenite/antimonite-responsive transcriptional repressor